MSTSITRASIFCFAIVAFSVLWQWGFDLPSCSKCIFQRYLFVGAGVGFLLAGFASSWARIVVLTLVGCLTLYGLILASLQLLACPLILGKVLFPALATAAFLGLFLLACYCCIKEKGLKSFFAVVSLFWCSQAIVVWGLGYTIAPALSGSLSEKLFLIGKSKALTVGDFVAFQAKVLGKDYSLLKIIGGVAGDEITHQNGSVFVNGKPIGHVRQQTSCKKAVTPIAPGIIPAGKIFVYTPHPRSIDSRYAEVGLISLTNVVGRAYAIF